MFKPFKKLNSKGFLLLYLVIIVIMLTLWVSRLQIAQPETRDIPVGLKPYLVSPARPIPQFLLDSKGKQVLTNQSLKQHWSFIYFTHPSCQPECEAVLRVLENLRQYFAAADIQFLLINYDEQSVSDSAVQLSTTLPLYAGEKQRVEKLTKAFGFLFLRTQYGQGYQLEQQHDIFLVDPKGRVYARFEPPYSSLTIQQHFFSLRDFYARSE